MQCHAAQIILTSLQSEQKFPRFHAKAIFLRSFMVDCGQIHGGALTLQITDFCISSNLCSIAGT